MIAHVSNTGAEKSMDARGSQPPAELSNLKDKEDERMILTAEVCQYVIP